MKTIRQIIVRLIVGCVLAISLVSNVYGQDINPPPGGTNDPPTPEELEAMWQAYLALLETNRQSVLPYLHGSLALPDGTTTSFQDLVDWQATTFSASGVSMQEWQQSARDEALTWALAVGAPNEIPLEDGTTAFLISRENGVPLYMSGFNARSADTISTDELWPGGATGFDLTGTNRAISMWDEGMVRVSHSEFNSPTRVTMLDGNTNLNRHSTAVAGTLGAGGVNTIFSNGVPIGAAAKGMSFAAKIEARDFVDDLGEMTAALGTNNMRLSNHSYGRVAGWFQDINGVWYWLGHSEINTNQDPKFGNYTTNTEAIDRIIENAPTYLSVWAAGNDRDDVPPVQPTNHVEFTLQQQLIITNTIHPIDGDQGGYDTMSEQASAKNILTVGAVLPISGGYAGSNGVVLTGFTTFGPTDDGRIKPDVVADGSGLITTDATGDFGYLAISGTSFSAPSVAGSVNLLAERYKQLHPNASDLLAATLKGLVIHTADEAGTNAGPDFRFGWGLMNSRTAAELIGQNATNGLKNQIKEVLLPNGKTSEFQVVANGTNALKITTAWTDPAAPGNSVTNLDNPALKLVNDLDLRVIGPTGTTNFPWVLNPDLTNQTSAARSAAATTGDNARDNVEQVFISNPVTNGVYTVRVNHKGNLQSNATQWVSVLLSGIIPQPKPDLKFTLILPTSTNTIALGWQGVVGQRYQVQSIDALGSTNWVNMGGQISAWVTNVVTEVPFSLTNSQRFYRVAEVE